MHFMQEINGHTSIVTSSVEVLSPQFVSAAAVVGLLLEYHIADYFFGGKVDFNLDI